MSKENLEHLLQVLPHLAELTNQRQREQLEITLAEALMACVEPQAIQFLTLVAKGKELSWFSRGCFFANKPPQLQEIIGAQFEDMELLGYNSARLLVYQSASEHVSSQDKQTCTIFPVLGEHGVESLVEITTATALQPLMMTVVKNMLQVFLNMNILLDHSERDGLTGLLNIKSFQAAFLKAQAGVPLLGRDARIYDMYRESEIPDVYWIAMVDIDYFKRVNDKFGHLVGDDILFQVAQLLKQNFRFHDRMYRFGGEEFIILMRCHNLKDATTAVERFRKQIHEYEFSNIGSLTMSIGLTQLLNIDTPATALDRVAKAIYRAKTEGRNRVAIELPEI